MEMAAGVMTFMDFLDLLGHLDLFLVYFRVDMVSRFMCLNKSQFMKGTGDFFTGKIAQFLSRFDIILILLCYRKLNT